MCKFLISSILALSAQNMASVLTGVPAPPLSSLSGNNTCIQHGLFTMHEFVWNPLNHGSIYMNMQLCHACYLNCVKEAYDLSAAGTLFGTMEYGHVSLKDDWVPHMSLLGKTCNDLSYCANKGCWDFDELILNMFYYPSWINDASSDNGGYVHRGTMTDTLWSCLSEDQQNWIID